jgi:hypothetical protein
VRVEVDEFAWLGGGDGAPLGSRAAEWFERLGVDVEPLPRGRRPLLRVCTDWTERRAHLAGALGAALCTSLLHAGWVARHPTCRALQNTQLGEVELRRFGLDAVPPDVAGLLVDLRDATHWRSSSSQTASPTWRATGSSSASSALATTSARSPSSPARAAPRASPRGRLPACSSSTRPRSGRCSREPRVRRKVVSRAALRLASSS